MRRKFLVFLLIFVLTVSVSIVEAFAAGTIVSIEKPEAMPKKGESFTVSLKISGNTGLCAAQFTLVFDKDKMVCDDIKTGSVLAGSLSAGNENASLGAMFAAASTSDKYQDGEIACFYFTATEDIASLDFNLKKVKLADSSGKSLIYEIIGGTDVSDAEESQKETEKSGEEITEAEDDKNQDQDSAEKNDENNGGSGSIGGSGSTGGAEDKESSVISDSGEETAEEGNAADDESEKKTASSISDVYAFTDTKGHWGESYIYKAVEYGLFKGNSDGSFGPNNKITRAQFVTVLYRNAGSPDVEIDLPFADTNTQSEEFKKAISWAYSKGYISGRSEKIFDPTGSLTRQEAMKILFAYSGGKSGGELMNTLIYDNGFSDSNQIASWAKPAVYWAYYNKIISGTSATTVSPQGTATRAQLAKILVEYIDRFEK